MDKEESSKKTDKRSDSTLADEIDQGGVNPKSPVNLQVSSRPPYEDEKEEDDSMLQVAEESSVPIQALIYNPKLSFEARKKSIQRASQYFRNRSKQKF